MRSLLWLIGVLASPLVATPVDFDARGVDRTSDYQQVIQDLAQKQTSWAKYRNYKIIFVNGFLSDQFALLETWPIGNQFARPFEDQKKWLADEGVEFEVLATKTQQIPEINVPTLVKAVLDSTKPIIFISHSRGGLDVLQTLLTAEENVLSKIKGWVALQAPFQGTPMADEVLRDPRIKKIVAAALHKLGGSMESVVSMSTEIRKKFMTDRDAEIRTVLARIPMISFSSWKPNNKGRIDTTYELQRNYLESLGYQTDGLVPWQSEIIPGMNFVFQFNVDHPSTVNRGAFLEFDRVQMTQGLLKMLETQLQR